VSRPRVCVRSHACVYVRRDTGADGSARYVDGTGRLPVSPLNDAYLVLEAPQSARSVDTASRRTIGHMPRRTHSFTLKFRSETGNADTQHAAQGQAQRERGTSDTPRPKANAANTRTRSARTHQKQGPTPDRAVATAKRKNENAKRRGRAGAQQATSAGHCEVRIRNWERGVNYVTSLSGDEAAYNFARFVIRAYSSRKTNGILTFRTRRVRGTVPGFL
jgi:hypothetical protein